MPNEPTNLELSQGITEVKEITSEILEAMNAFSDRVDQRFNKVENRLDRIESTMVTKLQLNGLINILQENKVISSYEAKTVKAIS